MFKNEYLGEFIKNPEYEAAFKLWIEYFYYTEVYDRSICSGVSEYSGDAIPIDNYERKMINQNATRLRKELYSEAETMGIDNQVIHSAKVDASKYAHNQIVELMKVYGK